MAKIRENKLLGAWRRFLHLLARMGPGAETWRPRLHRWRGVKIEGKVWIGYDCIIETSNPDLVTLKNGVILSLRTSIIAHFRESQGVLIDEDVFIGPGVIIMPGVKIGKGAVVAAGSVVTASVPPMTFVQGNPAKPVAKCGVPLTMQVSVKKFMMSMKPIGRGSK